MRASTAPVQTLAIFGRAHALVMLAAAAAALALRSAWPVALAGAASLCASVIWHRHVWTPAGQLGAANAVTVLRLLLIVALVPLARPVPDARAALLVLAIFALDAVDGWLARRTRSESLFGAMFDMECDALLVLVCSLVLYLSGRLGAFILLPGVLRYAYVTLLMFASAGPEAPRSRLGRNAFGLMMTSFIASLWPVGPVHPALAVAATALVVYSFAHSTLWSFMRR